MSGLRKWTVRKYKSSWSQIANWGLSLTKRWLVWIRTRIVWELGLWSNMRFLQLPWVNRYINSTFVYIHCIRRDTRHVHHFNSRIPISCHLIIFYNNSFILDFFHFDNQENLEMGNCYCPRIKIILKEQIIPSSSSLVIWGHLLIVFVDLGLTLQRMKLTS